MNNRLPIFLVATVALAGCGGKGADSSTPEEAAGAPFELGRLSGRAAITNPPITTNSPDVTATGLTGIITSLRLRDQKLLPGEGRLLFYSLLGGLSKVDLFSCNLDGSELVQVTSTPGIEEYTPAVSPDGRKIAFAAVGTGGDFEIFVMDIDGGNRVQLTNNDSEDSEPRWAPSGTSIVYKSGNEIQVINVNSKIVTSLATDFQNGAPDFTADGQTVIFHSTRAGDGFYHLYKVPSAGGAVTVYLNLPGSHQLYPRLSPDGLKLLYYRSDVGERFLTLGGGTKAGPVTDSGNTVYWSADSEWVAFNRINGSFLDLVVSKPDGSEEQVVLGELLVNKMHPQFIPAPKDVVFVGAGSLFGSRLAGFVSTQSGENVRALVGFDAATPTSAVMTRQTGENNQGPNLVYSIDADVVTEIAYAHAPYWKPTRVVGGGTGVNAANGALINLDSVSGRVVAVLPFAGVRSKASFEDKGTTRVFTGNFLGVFDGSGKNLGAANEVSLDLESGELQISR